MQKQTLNKLCAHILSWYLNERFIHVFFFLFLYNGGDIILFSPLPLSFSSPAMTMQFISHRFPDYHDPTIGEYRLFSRSSLSVSACVRLWDSEKLLLKGTQVEARFANFRLHLNFVLKIGLCHGLTIGTSSWSALYKNLFQEEDSAFMHCNYYCRAFITAEYETKLLKNVKTPVWSRVCFFLSLFFKLCYFSTLFHY